MNRRAALLVDTEDRWIRQPRDLVGASMSLLGIVAILAFSVYASSTTLAVTTDVREATNHVLTTVFIVPVNVLEGLLTFFAPLAVLIELMWTRRWRALSSAVLAMALAGALSNVTVWFLKEYLPESPVTTTLAVAVEGQSLVLLVPYMAIISALCTAAGTRGSLVSVRWTWPLLWTVVILSILQGQQTLPGALSVVLLGSMVGQLVVFILGTIPERASGLNLVRLVRRAGIDATEIVRVGSDIDIDNLYAWRVTTSSPVGYLDRFGITQLQEFINRTFDPIDIVDEDSKTESIVPEALVDPVAVFEDYEAMTVPTSDTVSRNYIIIDSAGVAHHASVLDGDRHILSWLSSTWSKIRLRIQYRRSDSTIHDTADQVALMTLAAQHNGIIGPDLVGVSSSDDSAIIVTKLLRAPSLHKVPVDDLTDDVIDQLWDVLITAHRGGLAHRNIHAGIVLVDNGELIVTNWHDGTIASSEISRRIDLAQGLAMLATIVGVERALASFERVNGREQLMTTAPIMQRSIMPRQTLSHLDGKTSKSLREAIAAKVPSSDAPTQIEVRRFSPKTVASVIVGVLALYILLGSINFSDVWAAIRQANPVYLAIAFVAGSVLTYFGAALHLKAYTPEKLPIAETAIVQVAASIITLVVPAGIGPAALNLRYLNKKGIPTTLGVATVSLVQIAQLLTTILTLLLISLLTGQIGALALPSGSLIFTILTIIALIAALLLIKPLRRWLFAKVRPTFEQVWPRVVWLTTHPDRILLGVAGSLLQSVGYVMAFGFALASFGYSLPVMTLAITFLISNTLGSVVPSPGGIGPVEAALTGGLAVAGIPYSIALSTALIYRLFTFWGRVPLGWFALRYLQHKDLV
ncbi:lysylphosphatidylglycerol synthase transmembrane domain-containing protein [Flaviflexus equikiangi]|uniref:Flippase-like domain-containing protein n=1 Tax=Flaviflexus equikiangi TaxID=2758573 RepID=A0ABS2TBU7_9ACTO|nr:lysylphosphatidylglycerol synthase transmembrane domain-containing protein [Flaviflexus equikiangi]MBM9432113.1 flippase-like domain-containing protein [Flaviflexus equikiangi]